MRVLILGATGQIGSHLAAACQDRGLPHLGTFYTRHHADYVPLDLRDADAVRELVADYRPDVVFLAAGLTCSGYAEAFPAECEAVVGGGTRAVAEAVRDFGGTLVAFGSDEVFGDTRTACHEGDALAPGNGFARCHTRAESVIRETLPGRHLIVRTGWVFGPDARGHNLALTLLKKLRRGDTVEAHPDAHGHPTYAPDLAEVALELARAGETGTVHAVGPDRHTAYTFARLLAHVFGVDSDRVRAAAETHTPRPRHVWLDRTKLRTLLGKSAIRTAAEGLRGTRAGMNRVAAAVAHAA